MYPILSDDEHNMARHIYKAKKFHIAEYEIAECNLQPNEELYSESTGSIADVKRCVVWNNENLKNGEVVVINNTKYISYHISRQYDLMRNYKVQGNNIKKVLLCFNDSIIYEGFEGPTEPFPLCLIPYGALKLFLEVNENDLNNSVSFEGGMIPSCVLKELAKKGPMYMEQYKCIIDTDKGVAIANDIRYYEYKANTDVSKKRTVKTVHTFCEAQAPLASINLSDPLTIHKEITNICVKVEKNSVNYVALCANDMIVDKTDVFLSDDNSYYYTFKLYVCPLYNTSSLIIDFKERVPHTVELTRDYNTATEYNGRYMLPKSYMNQDCLGLVM